MIKYSFVKVLNKTKAPKKKEYAPYREEAADAEGKA